jgi:hypothetical protein
MTLMKTNRMNFKFQIWLIFVILCCSNCQRRTTLKQPDYAKVVTAIELQIVNDTTKYADDLPPGKGGYMLSSASLRDLMSLAITNDYYLIVPEHEILNVKSGTQLYLFDLNLKFKIVNQKQNIIEVDGLSN